MHVRAVGRRRLVGLTSGLVVALAAWNDLVVSRLPGYPGSYVIVNEAATAALLAAAGAGGLTWEELGLSRRALPAGLGWGGACFLVVAAGCGMAAAVPALRPLITDARIAGMDGAELAYQSLVRVPFGTVVWEEVAFRGVLLAMLARLLPVRSAVAASSAVFGVWHIRPALEGRPDQPVGRRLPTAAAVASVCLGTAAGGVLLCLLRLRSGSLLAPVLTHLATNSLGTVAAAAASRLG